MTPRKPTRAKKLGVDDDEYQRLLAAQGGHCALCPNVPRTRRLHTDHDHVSMRVRGLLCYVCNKYLPASRDADWHRRAADYLEAAANPAKLDEAEQRVLGGGGQKGCSVCEAAAARLGVSL